jgi:hypothetical protein
VVDGGTKETVTCGAAYILIVDFESGFNFLFFQFCSPKQSTAHLATEHSIAEDMTKHDQGNVAPLFVGKTETQWTYAKIILKFLKYSGIEQASPSFTPIRWLIFSSAIDVVTLGADRRPHLVGYRYRYSKVV